MGSHILYGSATPSFATSDTDWYGVAAEVGKRVNNRAHRGDITAVIGATAGHGAPACFVPSLAEMHLNTVVCDLGDPGKVDLEDRLWSLGHAAAVGAMDHEAAHARHTKFDPRDLMDDFGATRKMIDVITTLEEPRIERNAVRYRAASREFIRPMALEIVARDFDIPDSRYGAAAAAGLLLARVDAGVFTKADARPFRADIRKVLGETLDELEPLWQRFLRLRDDDFEGMVDVARLWLDALGEDSEDSREMVGESLMGKPLPGEGEGEPKGEPKGAAKGFGKRIMGKARRAGTRMDGEMVEARGEERAERARAERKADSERRAESKGAHTEAFGPPAHGYSPEGFAHLDHIRPPMASERRAARTLATALEKIDYHDRAVTKVSSMVPPGRLRGGAAVQAAAMRSQGRVSQAPLWSGKRRTKVDSTPLTIGILTDISGSMRSAMEPLASAQWVLSNAGMHIDAKVASVHFGIKVHGVTPAGVRERDVRVFEPSDGHEAFKNAALAIDRELNLLDGNGARVLFIASDGHFVRPLHEAYARTFIPLAMRRGVAVMFLDFTNSMGKGSYGAPVIDCKGKTPIEVANVVGRAAIAEMRRIDSRT